MRWALRRSNRALAARVPDGGLRRFLATEAPARGTRLDDLALLALDFETTGLDPQTDRIASVGMLDVDGLHIPLGTSEGFLVDPEREVGQSAVIHQLTDDSLRAEGISLTSALDRVFDRLAGRILLAHHAAVEVDFLTAAVFALHRVRIHLPAVDTLRLGLHALGEDASQHPEALRLWRLRARASLPVYRGHDALTDALACAELYLALAQETGLETLGALRRA